MFSDYNVEDVVVHCALELKSSHLISGDDGKLTIPQFVTVNFQILDVVRVI